MVVGKLVIGRLVAAGFFWQYAVNQATLMHSTFAIFLMALTLPSHVTNVAVE